MIRMILPLLVALYIPSAGFANAYQANANAGIDIPTKGDRSSNASFLQGQLSTYSRFLRFQTAFSLLAGSGYVEGEVGLGISIYILSLLIHEKAPVHPFLMATGTAGMGKFKEESRLDAGYGYGAGVDLKFFSKSGLTISVQQHSASEDTLRYVLGFYWVKINY